jgi:hypothetical protein
MRGASDDAGSPRIAAWGSSVAHQASLLNHKKDLAMAGIRN